MKRREFFKKTGLAAGAVSITPLGILKIPKEEIIEENKKTKFPRTKYNPFWTKTGYAYIPNWPFNPAPGLKVEEKDLMGKIHLVITPEK
ncbi:MAG: hypothetical protein ACW98D_21910 [Promethearchaeota archaeon]|jgi:hypothetical protein